MTQSFTETIENNFESAKSEIEAIKSTYTPLSTINSINQAILSLNSAVNKTITELPSSGTIELVDGSENVITPTGAVTFVLPSVSDTTIVHKITIELNLTTVVSINLGLGDNPNYWNKIAPDLDKTGVYDLMYEYSNALSAWKMQAIPVGAAE